MIYPITGLKYVWSRPFVIYDKSHASRPTSSYRKTQP